MKLLTQSAISKLQAQYKYGNDLDKLKVFVKVYDPCGLGTWFLLNMDPLNPDCLLAIVQEYALKIHVVSLTKLEAYRGKDLGMPLDVDPFFMEMNARELWERLEKGEYV